MRKSLKTLDKGPSLSLLFAINCAHICTLFLELLPYESVTQNIPGVYPPSNSSDCFSSTYDFTRRGKIRSARGRSLASDV